MKILPGQIYWKELKKKSRTSSFFHDCKTTNMGFIFLHTENLFYVFFDCDYLILTWYSKRSLKSCLEKLWKDGDFTLLNEFFELTKLLKEQLQSVSQRWRISSEFMKQQLQRQRERQNFVLVVIRGNPKATLLIKRTNLKILLLAFSEKVVRWLKKTNKKRKFYY